MPTNRRGLTRRQIADTIAARKQAVPALLSQLRV